jgi:hypothetical protein
MESTKRDIEAMRNVDVRTVDRSDLVELSDVRIDENLSQQERIAEFIRQIKNPYCYKCGDIVVKESFSNNGKSIDDCFEQYIGTVV